MSVKEVHIGLISPERIRRMSYGEVTNDAFVHYRRKREPVGNGKLMDNNASTEGFIYGGLFCERIFGPSKDYTCGCHKVKNNPTKEHQVCNYCGVQIEKSSVRGERLGHIELAVPVCHPWFLKSGNSSTIATLLGISAKTLVDVASYNKYMVLDPKDTELEKYQALTYHEFNEAHVRYDFSDFDDNFECPFDCGTGGSIIMRALQELNLEQLRDELTDRISATKSQSMKKDLIKRLSLVNDFLKSGNKPEWLMLTALPVLPPNLRPLSQLSSGVYATSDLNELYRTVIRANNRIKEAPEGTIPNIIMYNMCAELQTAVCRLFDNAKMARPATDSRRRPYKSLSASICGKHGRFRQNLLGKRVDYSGRSVIVVGPELKMYQCGLPKEMAIELFAPFVVNRLIDIHFEETGKQMSIKTARKTVETRADVRIWDALEYVIRGKCVLLNRAPTLHRLGIQAFEPVLVEGHAIKLHPLVCTGFNADFDGDQMAVHVPLSEQAQAEAQELLLATKNLLKPSDGKPVAVPSQDMVLGIYYLSRDAVNDEIRGTYANPEEAIMAYETKDNNQKRVIELDDLIRIRIDGKLVKTTLGKYLLSTIIPKELGFGGETGVDLPLIRKKEISQIIDKCVEVKGVEETTVLLDNLKSMGYKYSTRAALTVSAFDVKIPEKKKEILAHTDEKVNKINQFYNRGMLSKAEKSSRIIGLWSDATEMVTAELEDNMERDNPIHMMADSGARGSIAQIRQLAGMRGLIANASGAVIEVPIRRNYAEGLTVLDYFVSSRGARKGMADTALRTANSGYLTRKLVDVSQDVIIVEEDCGAEHGIIVKDITSNLNEFIEDVGERLIGRYLVNDFNINGVFVSKDKLLTAKDVEKLLSTGVTEFEIRSPMHCCSHNGVCSKCYGADLSNGKVVNKGVAVGVISAQSIGEPGTQLTMRTFHTGGIASAEDITQGLPRVEELFENRGSERAAILAPFDGAISRSFVKNQHVVTVISDTGEYEIYKFKNGANVLVNDGDKIKKGAKINNGMMHSSEILRVWGKAEAEQFIISEIQRTYRMQGVKINDKHIEVIVRQMFSKVQIVDSAKSDYAVGTSVSRSAVYQYNKNNPNNPIIYRDIICGIQKVATNSDSFLSAASFQETERVLVKASLSGAVDTLNGLKENVICGRLIPAGTGVTGAIRGEYSEIDDIKR